MRYMIPGRREEDDCPEKPMTGGEEAAAMIWLALIVIGILGWILGLL